MGRITRSRPKPPDWLPAAGPEADDWMQRPPFREPAREMRLVPAHPLTGQCLDVKCMEPLRWFVMVAEGTAWTCSLRRESDGSEFVAQLMGTLNAGGGRCFTVEYKGTDVVRYELIDLGGQSVTAHATRKMKECVLAARKQGFERKPPGPVEVVKV